jgi:hypothetical protein
LPIQGLMARPNGTNPDSSDSHKLARAAVLALQNALAASRQHPEAPEVWRPAQRRALADLWSATRHDSLVIGLRAGSVYVGDEAVLQFHADDPPFGRLRGAGIGELVLAHALPAERLDELLQQLTAMSDSDDADGELTALIDAAHIPGVELRAATDLPSTAAQEEVDWSALPPPTVMSASVRAIIQRDGAANLPALAARQLFDDSEMAAPQAIATAPNPVPCAHILERLMERIVEADDIATTTWLLTELERRPDVSDTSRARLLQLARQHCSVAWLKLKLDRGTPDELLQLSALVMQLGDDIAENFASAAAEVAHPLSQWLSQLLGHTHAPQDNGYPQPDRS